MNETLNASSEDELDNEPRVDFNDTNLKILLYVTKLKNMNVYVYEGESREDAKVSINGNQQLVTGWNYTVPYTEGMLLIAYPDKDVETEFEFQFWEANYVYINYTLVAEQEREQREREEEMRRRERIIKIIILCIPPVCSWTCFSIVYYIHRVKKQRRMEKIAADEKKRIELMTMPQEIDFGTEDQFNNDKEDREEWERIIAEVTAIKDKEAREEAERMRVRKENFDKLREIFGANRDKKIKMKEISDKFRR